MSAVLWERAKIGLYCYEETKNDLPYLKAVVFLDGERWVSRVFYRGELVDLAEWDGREAAMRNARGAMLRAKELRAKKVSVEEDFDDDCDE